MTKKEITKLFVRFLVTFAFMLIILIPLGFLLDNKVSEFVMILLFVTIAGGAFALEEYIHFKLLAKRIRLKEQALIEEELSTNSKKRKKNTKVDDKRGKTNGK